MKRVTGLGGVFFKSANRKALMEWYENHLGIRSEDYGTMFRWRDADAPERIGYTVWSPFAQDTDYFAPSDKPYMLNYRVEDLTGLMALLKSEGVTIIKDLEQHENGKFAWIVDPDGTKIELWEPVDSEVDPYL